TAYYNQQADAGILWNDPELGIDWAIANPLVSEKDKQLPRFRDFVNNSLL
ncbi:MAG: dTDP-4-dehydrorhamnose 3,5-epimerase family protein, partial [Chryseotalea sp.]